MSHFKLLFFSIGFILVFCCSFNANAQIISTITGNGYPDTTGDGGLATSAQIAYPTSIAIDAVGNKYIADTWNNRIRKINRDGIISTFAGIGNQGYSGDGGQATKAQLSGPNAVTVDAMGNVYISDGNNFCIRKVDTYGIITTIAGSGTLGLGDGGPATSAQLASPNSIQLDSLGNLYIADWGDQRIRKVDVHGIITTVAGNGIAGFNGDGGLAKNAQINFPSCLAIDKNGNIIFSDYQNSRIRKIDKNGIISTIAGNGTAGYSGDKDSAINATLNSPYGVAIDANGNVFFSDELNYCIRKINVNGIITTVVGNGNPQYGGDGGKAIDATLENPYGLAFDAAGNLYIADHDNNRIRKVTYSSPLTITSFTPTTASTGSTVTIKGKGFTGVFSVSFGGILSNSFSVLDDSTITAIVGNGASGNISISNLDSTKRKAGFIYCIPVTPTVSINSSAISVCAGTNVVFNAIPNNGGTVPTYQWIKNGTNIVGANNSTYNYAPADADVISCVMTANNACQTSTTATSTSINLAVTENVTPSVSLNAGVTQFCSGTSVNLTATPKNAGSSPSYNFFINGSSVQNGNSNTYTGNNFSDGDNVVCVLTANNECQTTATATSTNLTLSVIQYVIPSVNISASANQFCSGTPITITAKPTNAGNSPIYNFLVNGSSVQNGNSPTYISNAFVNGDNVTCIMTADNTCQTSSTATSSSVTLSVTSIVTPSISLATTNRNFCTGTTVTLTATSDNGGSSPTYNFLLNGTSVQDGNSNTYTSKTFSDGDNVVCVLTANNTCQTNSTAETNALTLSVTQFVTPSLNISASATQICSGIPVTITATPTNAGNSPTYNFLVNGISVQNDNRNIYTSSAFSDGDDITCILTANNPCQTSATATSSSVIISVTQNVVPSVSLATDKNNICSGISVTLTATPTNSGNSPNYNFLLNGLSLQNGNSPTLIDNTLNNLDKVTCIMTANNVCQTTATSISNEVIFSITQNITPSVNISASATKVCNGTQILITSTPTNPGSSPTFNFLINGLSVQNGNSSTYYSNTFSDGDKITCLLTANNICQTVSTVTSNMITEKILLPTSSTSNVTVCSNTLPYSWNGKQYSAAGSYLIHLTNAVGCDSAATLHLIIIDSTPNYIWTGTTSTNWNDATNWSNNLLPTSSDEVVIPSLPTNQPVLTSTTQFAGIILNGVLSLNGQEVFMNGKITGSGFIKSTTSSKINIVGQSDTLNFDPSANSVGILRLNGGTVTLGNPLNITAFLEGTSGSTLNTGNNLTLKSTANGTAVTSNLTGVIVNGKVNIERYIPKGYAAFRDLGVCVSGAGTIAATWGQSLLNYNTYSFDATANPAWRSVLSSNILQPYTGYRILVSGYRNSVIPTKSASFMNSDVTLGYSGSLLIGNQNIPLTSGVNKFSFISNPYPSQVNFNNLSSSGLYNGYWYLSPTLIDSNYENYNYYGVDIGVSNIYAKNATQMLQPGQAFFVCSNSNSPSLTFTESSKDNSGVQAAIFGTYNPLNRIAIGLFSNGNNLDGAVAVFNSGFSPTVGKEDGLKINNQGENLTFNVNGTDLCANATALPKASDVLPLHLYQLQAKKNYTLQLNASQFQGNGLKAYLKDNKTNSKTFLNGDSTVISFSIDSNTDTSFANRYSIVFVPTALPVFRISANTSLIKDNQVLINWSILEDGILENFIIEHSHDGVHFSDLQTVSNGTLNNLYFIDKNANEGTNYYRIKAINADGNYYYSNISRLEILHSPHTTINIYPNPVQERLNITFINSNATFYKLRILTNVGKEAFKKEDEVANNSKLTISTSNLATGVYLLEVTDAKGNKQLMKFVKE